MSVSSGVLAVSDAPAWVDQPVINEKLKLSEGQVEAVLKMMEVLREPDNLLQLHEIKLAVLDARYEEARCYWDEFSEDEQHALWVAPSYGGVFTTHERKVLQGNT